MRIQVSLWCPIFISFGYITRSGITASYASSIFNIWGNCILFSLAVSPGFGILLQTLWGEKCNVKSVSSGAQSCPTLCDPMDCSTPGFPIHHQLPELAQTHVHWDGDAIQPSYPLSPLLLLPSIFPNIRVFSNGLFQRSFPVLRIRWPKYWNCSFTISPSNEYSGLISFRMDWLDLLAVQGTLKSLLQHYSSKASVLQCSAFFIANSHIHT